MSYTDLEPLFEGHCYSTSMSNIQLADRTWPMEQLHSTQLGTGGLVEVGCMDSRMVRLWPPRTWWIWSLVGERLARAMLLQPHLPSFIATACLCQSPPPPAPLVPLQPPQLTHAPCQIWPAWTPTVWIWPEAQCKFDTSDLIHIM